MIPETRAAKRLFMVEILPRSAAGTEQAHHPCRRERNHTRPGGLLKREKWGGGQKAKGHNLSKSGLHRARCGGAASVLGKLAGNRGLRCVG